MRQSIVAAAMGAMALSAAAFMATPAAAMPHAAAPTVDDGAIVNVADSGWASRAEGHRRIHGSDWGDGGMGYGRGYGWRHRHWGWRHRWHRRY